MNRKILITGATGNVGFETIKALLRIKSDLKIVAGVRDSEKEKDKFNGKSIDLVTFDFKKEETFEIALKGISLVFLLRPPQISDAKKYFQPFINAAKFSEVQHIVFLSVQGADTNSVIPHHKIENIILKSGIPFTFLRPAYFMQNFLTTLNKDLVERNEIYLPAGRAKFTLVDLLDVGMVGAIILDNPQKHLNKSYDLTNNELLTFGEMADQLTEVLGKKITFRSPNLISFFIRKKKEKTPLVYVLVMIMLHFLPRFKNYPKTSQAINVILGEQSKSFKEFIEREARGLH